ncbi:MAG: N-6 DNA methylase [Kiritimatiellae bacterium]|nr:N-6 DNA methylase [Kiritimatiellia bacterium]
MAQLENIEAIEKRLWSAADLLRTGSNYASNEYFMPVMGLIFLRHAYSRYLNVKGDIVASLPSRGGKPRELAKEDFSQKGAIFLRESAQFDYLVSLSDDQNRASAVVAAMNSIEADYENLKGILPKQEYHELDNSVLGTLLRTLNPDELKQASGDIFGRIYEYFLTQFADLKAHDGGEFFTPVSLVSLIAHVLEPKRGSVLDPACGSGGMFVQSARFVEQMQANPAEALTFYGMEKNPTTIRLAKMNLAVHGLEGDIQKAITYYEDPHELLGKADYVMANPPFNTDEVDADKVKRDPRLPFGLPGVNKKEKISNGNYLWISYFYSYLSQKGRAGFVMSSQASSAGGDEAKVRQKLIESGAVEAMIDIRGNFFYTRSVPCQLWFIDRGKPDQPSPPAPLPKGEGSCLQHDRGKPDQYASIPLRHKGNVLMIDARNVYRKVTRKIFDFTPEQEKNLNSIFWLYREESERFVELVGSYLADCVVNGVLARDYVDEYLLPYNQFITILDEALKDRKITAELKENNAERKKTVERMKEISATVKSACAKILKIETEISKQHQMYAVLSAPMAGCHDLIQEADLLYKQAGQTLELYGAIEEFDKKALRAARAQLNLVDDKRKKLIKQLKEARYFHKQAHWLLSRFPEGKLRDVEGLVKLVAMEELEANDWSLTPGRYVGVAPEEVDENFDFEEALRDIHVELAGLNDEAVELAAKIAGNFEELGV